MKRVLFTASLLLCALLLRGAFGTPDSSNPRGAAPTVRIIATGHGSWPASALSPRRLLAIWSGPDRVDGARVYGGRPDAPASRWVIALVGRRGGIRQHLFHEGPEVSSKVEHLRRRARVGDLIVAAGRGRPAPGPSQAGPWEQVDGGAGSTIYVERLEESGWSTVRLLRSLRDGLDLTLSTDAPPLPPLVEASGDSATLLDALVCADGQPPTRHYPRALSNGALDALGFPPAPAGGPGPSLVAEDVHLDGPTTFRARVVVTQHAYGRLERASFSLRLDGEVLDTLVVPTQAGELNRWHDWSVRLPSLPAGPRTLEVRAEPAYAETHPSYVLGAPQLIRAD